MEELNFLDPDLVPSALPVLNSQAPPPPPPPPPSAPVRKPLQRLPPLTLGAKVAVAVAAMLVVGAVAGFLVYWLVFHNRKAKPGGQGSNKFGTILVTDTSTHAQRGLFAPGDVCEISYTPTEVGFSNRSVFSFSSDGGKTFPLTLSDPSYSNAVHWTIPDTVFTQQAVFRVHDADAPADYVQTTTAITIQPTFVLTSGPGLTRNGDIVFVNQLVTCTLSVDTALKGLTATGFEVQLSADATFQKGLTVASVQPAVIDTAANTVQLGWVLSQPLQGVYYRISTTQLVTDGQPYELSATSPRTIQVAINDSCDGKTDDGSTFVLCQITMTESGSGVSGNFSPGSGVTLYVAYRHTYPGSATFSYTVDGGASVPWATAFSHQTDTLLVFLASLPDLVTSRFQITVLSGTQLDRSDEYQIVPSLNIQLPSSPLTSFAVTQYHSPVTNFSVAVVVDPPTYRPTWQIGYQQTDGSGTVLWPAANITSVTYAGSTATLVWVMDWADFGASTPQGQLLRRLVVSANQNQAESSVPVIFNLVSYAPTLYPLIQVGHPSYPVCGSVATAGGNGVNVICLSGLTSLAGLWPDPNGSNNVYIVVNDTNNNHVVWWGNVLENQNITAYGPLAPNPVNYTNAVVLPGPTIAAPPAAAQLCTLSHGDDQNIVITPTSHPTQSLYADTFSASFNGIYALAAGTLPGAASQFYWNQQRLPPLA